MVLDYGVLNQVFSRQQQLPHLVVLTVVMRNGVVVWKVRSRVVHEAIEQLQRLRHVHANALVVVFLGHRLFYKGYMVRSYFANLFGKQLPCLFERHLSAFVQVFYFEDFV